MRWIKKITLQLCVTLLFFGCQVQPDDKNVEYKIPNVEEELITFTGTEGEASLTRNFYFLFDGSGSMDEQCANERKIDGAKRAIIKFLDKVPEDVNLGLLLFGVSDNEYGIKELVSIGPGNREKFKDEILKVGPDGGTPLENATLFGVQQLVEQYKKQLGYGEYRLIIVTDGLANSVDLFESALVNSLKYPFIGIYGIGLCIDGNHLLKTYSLSYTDANDYEELGKALEETIAELEDFDPTEFNPDDFVVEKEE